MCATTALECLNQFPSTKIWAIRHQRWKVMAANVRGGSMKTCFTLMFHCSFQKHFWQQWKCHVLGKNIEILLIFIKPLQCSRQLQTSRLALILMKLMIRLRQFKYQSFLLKQLNRTATMGIANIVSALIHSLHKLTYSKYIEIHTTTEIRSQHR